MKEKILEFYVNKFNYINKIDDIELSFIPPILKRRLSQLDKIALSALNSTYTNNIQYIVFSSQFGEVDKLIKLIGQYTQNKEVSPNVFSGSVHNFGAGFFILNKQISTPYTTVSSCENSISSGLLASVISNYDNVLYCYSDVYNGQANTFALNLSKKEIKNSVKYQIKFKNNNHIKDDIDEFIKLFSKKTNSIKTSNCVIERVIND